MVAFFNPQLFLWLILLSWMASPLLIYRYKRDWYYRFRRIPFFYHRVIDLDGNMKRCVHKTGIVKEHHFKCGDGEYGYGKDREYSENDKKLVYHKWDDSEPLKFSKTVSKRDERVSDDGEKIVSFDWSAQFFRAVLQIKAVEDLHNLGGWTSMERLVLALIAGVGAVAIISAFFSFQGVDLMNEIIQYGVKPYVPPDGGNVP